MTASAADTSPPAPPAAPPPPSPREIERSIMARLAAPFSPDIISWRPGAKNKEGNKAQALAYIDARDVQNRLDEVFGFDWEIRHYAVGNDHVCCEITVTLPSGKKVTRTNGCWVGAVEVRPSKDGKVESKEEDRVDREAKWALSDAFKRAAVMFGVGKYLYDMKSPYMPLNNFDKFDDDTLSSLKRIAAKPFDEWQVAREQRAAEARRKAAAAQGAPPRTAPTPKESVTTPTPPQAQPPSAPAAPAPEAAPAPAAPAAPTVQSTATAPAPAPVTAPALPPPTDTSAIAQFERRAAALTSEKDFGEFVASTRATFADGTEEKKRLAAAVRAAAARLKISPKKAPSTAPQPRT